MGVVFRVPAATRRSRCSAISSTKNRQFGCLHLAALALMTGSTSSSRSAPLSRRAWISPMMASLGLGSLAHPAAFRKIASRLASGSRALLISSLSFGLGLGLGALPSLCVRIALAYAFALPSLCISPCHRFAADSLAFSFFRVAFAISSSHLVLLNPVAVASKNSFSTVSTACFCFVV